MDNSKNSSKILTILLIGASFVAIHELGHFIFAAAFNLDPALEFMSSKSSMSGLFGLSVGVSYIPASATGDFFVIFGATILPLLIAVAALTGYIFTKKSEFALIFEIYMVLIVINIIPLPFSENLDANKLWKIIFSS